MLSPLAVCTHCGDEYASVEYASVPVDPDEVQFCSDACEERYRAAVEAEEAYGQAGWSAPVF